MENKLIVQNHKSDRNIAIDYLRTIIILLVIVLHSILAYAPWATKHPANYILSTAPIIDTVRASTFSLLPIVINGFCMALMFFISGLYTWSSIHRKGIIIYMKDRLTRLGIPFLAMLTVIMPIAYYPSQIQYGKQEFLLFWRSWSWNSGPGWFLSMLLSFDLIAVIIFQLTKKIRFILPSQIFGQTKYFFLVLLVLSYFAYLPLMAVYGPFSWTYLGPITIGQASRIALYLVYFLAGVALGARGLQTTFLNHSGLLAKQWKIWISASVVALLTLMIANRYIFVNNLGSWNRPEGWQLYGFAAILYSEVLTIACLGISSNFKNIYHPWLNSISSNSYAIYIVHYPYVTWTQYALLDVSIPPELKAIIVITSTIGLSWGTGKVLRSVPTLRNIV